MAKKTARKAPFAASAAKQKKANPFEALHSKKKFNVIGRQSSGAQKNVNKARSEAVDRRKKTLLVEYKQLKKANAFIDRRFGEGDNDMTEDEKAIARFQAERMRQARKNKFVLAEEEAAQPQEQLTHLGNPLGALDDFKDAVPEAYGDESDMELADEIVRQYHFGGGEEAAADGRRKSKKEVMAEIIAKSKEAKAAKRQQKDEDEDLLDKLDAAFSKMQKAKTLSSMFKAVGESKGERRKADTAEDAQYDVSQREMAFEARGQAGERQLAEEELLEKERERLAKLERARKLRMEGADDEAGEDVALPEGGFARRRALARKEEAEAERKAQQAGAGGAEDEDDLVAGDSDSDGDSGGDDDGGAAGAASMSALDLRRAARSAGDHPLQQDFRALTAQILMKHGVQPSEQSRADLEARMGSSSDEDDDEDGDEDESGEDGEGREESGDVESGEEEAQESDGDGTGSSEEDSGDLDSDEEADILAKMEEGAALRRQRLGEPSAGASSGEDEEDNDDGDDDEDGGDAAIMAMLQKAIAIKRGEQRQVAGASAAAEEPVHPTKRRKLEEAAAAERRASGAAASAPGADSEPLDIPYTLPVPRTYAEFADLVRGRSASDTALIVHRIRVYNAAALTAGSKVGLQSLYGIVMQHFTRLAGDMPAPRATLDALTPLLVTMTGEVPLYAATLARAQLERVHAQLSESLKQPESMARLWPTNRTLVLARLYSVLFPASDRRHPVLTPLALILGLVLSHCPPNSPRDAAVALFLAAVLQSMAAAGGRYAPEVTPLCESLLRSALPADRRGDGDDLLVGHLRAREGWLHGVPLRDCAAAAPLAVADVLERPEGDPHFTSAAFRAQCLVSALALVDGQRAAAAGCDGAAAALAPLLRAVRDVERHAGLSGKLLARVSDVVKGLEAASAECEAARRPLVCPAIKSRAPKKLFNPRFEVDFEKERDYDPDRERAENKKMRRVVTKEQRALKRELARDAAFMGEVRRKEKERAGSARDKTQRKAIAFLQQQESDFKSGGQSGMNPHLKGKKK